MKRRKQPKHQDYGKLPADRFSHGKAIEK